MGIISSPSLFSLSLSLLFSFPLFKLISFTPKKHVLHFKDSSQARPFISHPRYHTFLALAECGGDQRHSGYPLFSSVSPGLLFLADSWLACPVLVWSGFWLSPQLPAAIIPASIPLSLCISQTPLRPFLLSLIFLPPPFTLFLTLLWVVSIHSFLLFPPLSASSGARPYYYYSPHPPLPP